MVLLLRVINWVRINIFKELPPKKDGERILEVDLDAPISNPVGKEPKINKAGLEIITHFEGYFNTSYLCPAKVYTIGYGTIRYPYGASVKKGEVCNKEQALHYLKHELLQKEKTIDAFLNKHGIKLTDNQYSAVVSFCYNLGTGPLVQTGRSLHNAIVNAYFNKVKVASAMLLYNKAGGKKLRGLVRRREAEAGLFLT